MNKPARVGRLRTAVTNMVEAAEDLRYAEEPALQQEVQELTNRVRERMLEVSNAEASAQG